MEASGNSSQIFFARRGKISSRRVRIMETNDYIINKFLHFSRMKNANS